MIEVERREERVVEVERREERVVEVEVERREERVRKKNDVCTIIVCLCK